MFNHFGNVSSVSNFGNVSNVSNISNFEQNIIDSKTYKYYINWPDNGPYVNDLNKVYDCVSKYLFLNFQKESPSKKEYVAIFDLDDTVFYSDPLGLHNIEKVARKTGKLIYPGIWQIIKLVNLCNNLGIKVIFITARPYATEESSKINLSNLGMKYYKMYHNKNFPDSEFKIDLQKKISKKYRVIFAIGDSWNDIRGLKKCLCIKLPKYDDIKTYFTYDNDKYYLL